MLPLVLATGASYALASLLQRWWGSGADPPPGPVDLPAVALWGDADRAHGLADTEDPTATHDAVRSLL